MTLLQFVEAHPVWSLVYLCVGGALLVSAAAALRGGK